MSLETELNVVKLLERLEKDMQEEGNIPMLADAIIALKERGYNEVNYVAICSKDEIAEAYEDLEREQIKYTK